MAWQIHRRLYILTLCALAIPKGFALDKQFWDLVEPRVIPKTDRLDDNLKLFCLEEKLLQFWPDLLSVHTAVLLPLVKQTHNIQGGPKKRYPCFIFTIISVNVHRF